MTPFQFLFEVCEPNYEEFVREPTSFRRAWAAATSLFHVVDCIAVHRGQTVSDVRLELLEQFPALSALADIANAGKHFQLDRGERTGLSADHFRIGSGAAFTDGSYFSDGSSFSDIPDVIRIEYQGSQIDVLHLCGEAIAFFRTKILDNPTGL
jgi:hypothetical protein